jgi:hypothetical protein
VIATIPYETVGDTRYSSVGPSSSDDPIFSCSYAPLASRGDWYTLTGQGTCLTANRWSQTSTVLAVYTGFDCQSMSCVAQQSYGSSSVKWTAEEGQQYWILLSGASNYESGEYGLVITVCALRFCFPFLYVFAVH